MTGEESNRNAWRPTRARVAFAALMTVALVGPIAWTLAAPGARTTITSPMAPELPDANDSRVNFSRIDQRGDVRFYEMDLSVPVPMDLVRHTEIHIRFSQNDMTSPHPASGRLVVVGTECAFDMQPNAQINGGIPQVFLRNDKCAPPVGRATGELVLTVTMGGPGDLGLYTSPLMPDSGAGGLIYVAERSEHIPNPPPALTGFFVDELPDYGLKRAHLLAYMWGASTDARRVWLGVVVVAVLAFAGIALAPCDATSDRHGHVARAAASAFGLALALSLAYVLLVPPVQAADETHHVASYTEVTAQPWVTEEAKGWAATAHVGRIRGRARERFRPQDVGHPEGITEGFYIHKTFARSSLTARYWQVLGRVLPELSAPRLFLAVRVINATIFAAAVGAAAAMLVFFTRVAYPYLLAFPFFFVPTLPFFGMHFGESALVTSVSVLFATIVMIMVLGGRQLHWLGWPLGLVTSALVIGARNSLPMMPLVATTLVLRVVMSRDRSGRPAGIFWGGFGLGASLYWLVIAQPHLDVIHETLDGVRRLLPAALAPAVGAMTQPWFPLLAAAAGWLAEVRLGPVIARLSTASRPALTTATRIIPIGLAVAVIVSLIGSFWWEYPVVESIQGDGRLPLKQYLEQVAGAALTSFRLTRPGLLLSSSFWVGFGWLDTIPGPTFVGFLVAATAVAWIGLLLHIARQADVSRFAALAIMGLGLVVTFAGYTYASYAALTNLHGRYLLGWYLTMIAIFWTWPAIAPSRSTAPGSPWRRSMVLSAVIVFVHAYSLTFILRRYF